MVSAWAWLALAAQWAAWVAPAVKWLAWVRPVPWVDRAAHQWVALVDKWLQAKVAFNLSLAERRQVVLLAPLRHHVDHQLCKLLWVETSLTDKSHESI